jgi:hypothetical protein
LNVTAFSWLALSPSKVFDFSTILSAFFML